MTDQSFAIMIFLKKDHDNESLIFEKKIMITNDWFFIFIDQSTAKVTLVQNNSSSNQK